MTRAVRPGPAARGGRGLSSRGPRGDVRCPGHRLLPAAGATVAPGPRAGGGCFQAPCGVAWAPPPLTATLSCRADEPVTWRASGRPRGESPGKGQLARVTGPFPRIDVAPGTPQPSLPLWPRPSASKIPPVHVVGSSSTTDVCGPKACVSWTAGAPPWPSPWAHAPEMVSTHDLTWTLARSGVGGTSSRSSLPEQSGLGPCVRGRGPHEHTLLWRSKAGDSGGGVSRHSTPVP